MASSDTWSDFDTLRHNIKHNTVDRLKQILAGLNEECYTSFFKSGKKQDIIDRIVAQLDTWRASNNSEKWLKAKDVIMQVRNTGFFTPTRALPTNPVHPAPLVPHSSYPSVNVKANPYHISPSTSSSVGRYDPYASPRKPPMPVLSNPSIAGASQPVIKFKLSPFFRVDQLVSQVVECPESASSTDRRQQTVQFVLTNDQISKLKSTEATYQLRLFCTSSTFYSPTPSPFRAHSAPCLIEFPPTCDVRVNTIQLTANLKGLKKKPGTAPPADLGKAVRLNPVHNRVEMIYVNSLQPVQHKKYYLAVILVEVTTVVQLVHKLKKGKYRSSEEIRQNMKKTNAEDDEIVAGPQKMSLKCPLSFMRVAAPCRSMLCVHPQCFDATSWFSMMEQTTTWLCPICERVLNYEDLIIDGYFDEILKQCSEDVEDVMVEADGEWHTADDKYGSVGWKASRAPLTAPAPGRQQPPVNKTPLASQSDSIPKRDANSSDLEIVVLDSDDEDEGWVKRELSPSFGGSSSVSAHQSFDSTTVSRTHLQRNTVIDLTLDSDDDEQPRRPEKRKAAEAAVSPTEQIWKKGRQDGQPVSAVPEQVPPAHSSPILNGSAYSYSHRSQSSQNAMPNRIVSARVPYSTSPFGGPGSQSVYPQYAPLPPRPAPVAGSPTLPPIGRNSYIDRVSRWPDS